jgi:putative membrane protein
MLRAFSQDAGWEAAHAPEAWWHRALGLGGPWLLAAVVCFFVVRALLHAKRFRAVGVLSERDIEALHEALRAAESKTVGEIVPVVVERSDEHGDARWLAALVLLLVGTAVLEPHLPWREPALLLLLQLALGSIGWGLARALPGYARLFVREARASAVAEEQAIQEFHRLDLHATEGATGVLLFVSLFERRATVLADRGIAEKVAPEVWQAVDTALLAGIARGSLRDGLVDGIARAGAVLAEQFPCRPGDRNELPDRVIVRRE